MALLTVTKLAYARREKDFEDRLLLLAIGHAQRLMNEYPPDDTLGQIDHARLQAKAVELLNQPDQFKERLSLSVLSFMRLEDLQPSIDDEILEDYVQDAFDALAGVATRGGATDVG